MARPRLSISFITFHARYNKLVACLPQAQISMQFEADEDTKQVKRQRPQSRKEDLASPAIATTLKLQSSSRLICVHYASECVALAI